MRIRMFGAFQVTGDTGRELSIGGPKQRTVLAMLCAEPAQPVPADRLIEAVWGDRVPDRAARSLSTFVSNLRRELGDIIDSGSGSYTLELDRAQIDIWSFADTVVAAERSNAARDAIGYREALAMWTGPPFAGLDGFGAFREAARRLDALHMVAERAVLEDDITSGDATSAVPRIDALIHEHPLDEELRGLHMRALYRCGRQAEALESFNLFRTRLAEDLGLDPSPELQDLEVRILQHDASIGAQRREPPPIGGASGLPNRYSSFVGREAEVAETLERMGMHRLVSLVGPGGIGKSSIAVAAAREMRRPGVTVVHVPIESIGKGDVAGSAARAIGLAPAPNVDAIDVIATYISTRPHMLVLDGCETHIAEVADFADRLLTMTECHLLATSREPMGLNGESTIRIDPLPLEAAVQVFRNRAQLPEDVDDTTLATIGSICDAIDRVPLAIELAASRARTIPLDRLADRLNDQIRLLRRPRSFDERHGSLLAALDWSYDLLASGEQATLLALSVFVTSFTIEDAEAVADNANAEDEVARLVEVSLLQPPDPTGHHRFLEPVRQYAHHRLGQSGDLPMTYRRHAARMATSAIRAGEEQWSPRVREVRAWIFARRTELLAAMDRALEADDPDTALTIIAALGRRFAALGVHGAFILPSLAALRHSAATLDRNYLVASAHTAWMLFLEGRRQEALDLLTRALAIAEESNDLVGLAEVKQRLAVVRNLCGEAPGDKTVDELVEAMELLRAADDPNPERFLYNTAHLLSTAGRFDEAVPMIEKARQWWEAKLSIPFWGYGAVMGTVRGFEGEWETALELFEEAATLTEAESMYRHAAAHWENAADAAVHVGSLDRLHAAAENHRRIAAMIGAERSVPLGIEESLAVGEYDAVLTLAERWFTIEAIDPYSQILLISPDTEETIHGSRFTRPRIFGILRPVTTALMETGRRDEACRIVAAVPGLMAESPFEYWDAYREAELWQPLFEACGNQEETDAKPLTLLEVFGLVEKLVTAEPSLT